MASSSLRKEILEAKKRLVYLQEDVKDFEKRLRQRIERTKKSVEQLSIDCELNCSKVWQEFDTLRKKARMKAEELCKQMRRKTTEKQSKWCQSLEEKEWLLEEAKKWLIDLHHLLGDGNNDRDIVCRVESMGAELSSRLHESLASVEEDNFMVTFPEWCQQSLNKLLEEIVDFTIETLPPRKLELQSECHLQDSNQRIHSITRSDEDSHVFVVDGDDDLVKEFSDSVEFVSQCPFENKRFLPKDICCLSKDNFIVSGWRVGGELLFLARKKVPFLEKIKITNTKETPFCSLCQMNEQIFVCDLFFKVILCFSKDGNQIKRIQLAKSPGLGSISIPLLRADQTTGNLWGTRFGMSEIFVFDQNGQILQIVKT